jgi:hypothetical protein
VRGILTPFGKARLTKLALLLLTACTGIPALDSRIGALPAALHPESKLAPLTTSLADARPISPWLEIIDPARRTRPDGLVGAIPANLGAGYFTITIKSFCLHAGTPAQSKGSGFGLAPFAGARATVLAHVLERSTQHPEIEQGNVQRLLWAIEDGHTASDLPPEDRVLLDANDFAVMAGADRSELEAAAIRFAGGLAGRFVTFDRGLFDPNVPYADLERIAVPDAPEERGPSHWTSVGGGLYVRATSEGYPTTRLELYRPQPAQFERDASHRIVSITSGRTRATIRDDARLGHGVAFVDLDTREETFIPDSILARTASRSAASPLFGFPGGDTIREYYQLFKSVKNVKDAFDALDKAADFATQPDDPASIQQRGQQALDEMSTTKYMDSLLVAAVGSPKAKAKALQKHLFDITDVAMYVICSLRGECNGATSADGELVGDGELATGLVAVPYDTGRQRLGLSNAAKPVY